jgi:PAS domain S-box-containing protein
MRAALLHVLGWLRKAGAVFAAAAISATLAFLYFGTRLPPIPNRPLRIGFENNPPVQIHTDNGFAGLAVETVNEAAKRAGVQLRWVDTGTSSDAAFQKKLVDLWPLMADLPDRRKRVHITLPWLHSSHTLLLLSGSAPPERGFAGRIASFKMPLHVRLLRERFPKAELKEFSQSQEVVKEVCRGTVAAGFLEGRVALTALREKPGECAHATLRIQTIPDLTLQHGVGSTFEAAGAAEAIRREIGNMFRDGSLAATMAKYSYYGLDDTWASYDLMEAAEHWRWMTWGISGLSVVLALLLWQASYLYQRKRAQAALRESEERFRNMADTAPVMIWLAGPDKLCNFFNRGWLDFTGRSMEQELGNGWTAGIHSDDLERCFASYSSSFDARETFDVEYRLRRADGEYRWVLCSGVPRFTGGGVFAGYIGSDIDVTDQKRAEAALRRSLNEIAHLNRVAAMGELTASLAHELNQPLAAILSNAQAASRFLSGHPPDLTQVRECLTDIAADDKRAGEVIKRLRALLRKEVFQASLVDTNEVVGDVIPSRAEPDREWPRSGVGAGPGLPLGFSSNRRVEWWQHAINGGGLRAGHRRKRPRSCV